MSKPIIAFCGMTHLGLNSAVAVAEHGFSVLCFDADKDLMKSIGNGVLPVTEPDLDDLFGKNTDRLSFSSDAADLAACDIAYIAADVPTGDQGQSDLSSIRALIDTVVANLNDTAILVVLCQVPPGFTRELSYPKRRLYYQVETLIFGRAVERAMYPERYIVGCDDPAVPLTDTFNTLLAAFDCPVLPMRYESAELAKISINMCLVASLSVANTMAEICEQIGADWSEIVPALKLDRRIGQYSYLNPGLGIAGGNLERDLATVLALGQENKTHTDVVKAWVSNSNYRKLWASRVLEETVLPGLKDPHISVWGLSYKENTHSIKNSPSLATIAAYPEIVFQVHDPVVKSSTTGLNNLRQLDTPVSAVEDADCLMILTPWEDYKSIDLSEIAKAMRGDTLVDPFGLVEEQKAIEAGLKYITLGHQNRVQT
ncbi:MAG: UDP-glucose/GDP-mannose dehydrogenase family protein [Rhodospirillales bacterium]|nr:UDP-glucose/GDP-mannose dehydrogenase family protein [Rhodospirillales bacterium]